MYRRDDGEANCYKPRASQLAQLAECEVGTPEFWKAWDAVDEDDIENSPCYGLVRILEEEKEKQLGGRVWTRTPQQKTPQEAKLDECEVLTPEFWKAWDAGWHPQNNA